MHIGFGQNTVSSLYGHQKGDHMLHKKLQKQPHPLSYKETIYHLSHTL